MIKVITIFFVLTSSAILSQNEMSLVLNGCTDYLEVADDDLIDFNNELSIEFWIRPNCIEGNTIVIGKEWCQGNFSYYASVAEGKIRWAFQSNGSCTVPNYFETFEAVIEPNIFTHVAITHSQTELNIYINGGPVPLDASNGNFDAIYQSDEPLRIGAYKYLDGSVGNFYSGLIDEVRLWNSELSEQLISSRYNEVLTGSEENLVLYYQFEENEVGPNLIIPNKNENLSISLNANPTGTTNQSPYCVDPQDYISNSLLGDTTYFLCGDNDSLLLTINEDLNYKSIEWSNGQTSSTTTVTEKGNYWVKAETERCRFLETSFTIENDVIFEIIDVEVCPESYYELNGSKIYPDETQEFFFQTSNGCDSIVSINVTALPTEDIFVKTDTITCEENIELVLPLINIKINNEFSENPIILNQSETYLIEGIDSNGCMISDSLNVLFQSTGIYIPNIIHLNSLSNDCFQPYFQNSETIYSLLIYDRWGNLVYNYTGNDGCWNGYINNKKAVQGTYTYLIEIEDKCSSANIKTGSLTVIK